MAASRLQLKVLQIKGTSVRTSALTIRSLISRTQVSVCLSICLLERALRWLSDSIAIFANVLFLLIASPPLETLKEVAREGKATPLDSQRPKIS